MKNSDRRRIGGENNKFGNRYETFFATARLLQFFPSFRHQGVPVRVKDQAGCHVDDLLIHFGEQRFYHQLKADKQITWGKGDLTRLFEQQMAECEAGKEKYRLCIVVAEDHRAVSLKKNLPAKIRDRTAVLHFPRPGSCESLENPCPDVPIEWDRITAFRHMRYGTKRNLARAFYFAYMDCDLDSEEFVNINELVQTVIEFEFAPIWSYWDGAVPGWDSARELLASIAGLNFWVDRGYFEYYYPPADQGTHLVRCDSLRFKNFVERVNKFRPKNFEELEILLP